MVSAGDMTAKQRNDLLAEMTDEVAALVLRDNYEQNLAFANAVAHAPSLLHVHEDWIRRLEQGGSSTARSSSCRRGGSYAGGSTAARGLTAPELAVLLAYTKIVLAEELLDSDLPDDPFLAWSCRRTSRRRCASSSAGQMEAHPLRREIIVTQVVNNLVNFAGITFFHRLARRPVRPRPSSREPTSSPARSTASLTCSTRSTRSTTSRRRRADPDAALDADADGARVAVAGQQPPAPLDIQRHRRAVRRTGPGDDGALPEMLTGSQLEAFDERQAALARRGVEEDLARAGRGARRRRTLLGVVEIAKRDGIDPEDVARVHFALGERLGLPS